MFYRHVTQHCLAQRAGETGLTDAELARVLDRLASPLAALKSRQNAAAKPLLDLASRTDDLAGIEALAEDLRGRFKQVAVVGSGGSSLSGRALAGLRLQARLHFLETIDPDAVALLLDICPPQESAFLIISKSGKTVETLGQFQVLLAHAEKILGRDEAAEHFTVITGAEDSPLRRLALTLGCRILDHDAKIGGRFAALTNVGLLPAAVAGLDIRALRRGAQQALAALDAAPTPAACEPALGTALQYAFMEKGRGIGVMMPYSERLWGLSCWWRQGWAESLGKEGRGTTPLRAAGTADQHSQLQLYLDGPKDKLFHLVTLPRAGTGQAIPAVDDAELAYLRGKTTGDIMEAEQKATLATLARHGCPVRVFELAALNEETLGALLMHFTLEIILMAELLSVNPFDQPAVEEGKRLAREYLLKGTL